MLEDKIRALRQQKRRLLMPHLVLGYPSFDESKKLIREMVDSGADIIEMQIPFSEPSDGPVILRANDEAVKNGATTTKCMELAKEVCAQYPNTLFVFMTYYNIPFVYGLDRFMKSAKAVGVQGLIVADLPPEEADDYLESCKKYGIDPIFLVTPTCSPERVKTVESYCKGMVYCVGRKGVTGIKTKVDESLVPLIKMYRSGTTLPLALGFGIQSKSDVDALPDDIDIAIIGTKILTLYQEGGIPAVGSFLKGLRN